jgi:hypothetical protein
MDIAKSYKGSQCIILPSLKPHLNNKGKPNVEMSPLLVSLKALNRDVYKGGFTNERQGSGPPKYYEAAR